MLSEKESKIVFRDGEQIRAIRGMVEKEDDFYIIRRRDGTLRLNKSCVLKIEEWNNSGEGNNER